jgi:hypothetical protein
MDREEGFPPHIIGFMRRKREKERLESEKPPKSLPFGEESVRTALNA